MMKVLIIDDSADAVAICKARLASEGVDVCCASGGTAGLEAATRERPDLILLDVNMPDLSGFEVCQRLKADPELCMIPVIFLTGSGCAEDKVRGLDLGAVDYISKPFDTFELRARVRAALRTKHLQDLLIEYARIDPLTSLPNRRALMERLEQEWSRVMRYGGRLSFIMADLDHFKNVNDTYGHRMGDRLLQEAARIIAGQCRGTDLPARYGGEEFAVIVPDESADAAARLAERCRVEIEQLSVPAGAATITITGSFGVAEADGTSSIAALMERADALLYEAKHAGRNRVVAATPAVPAARETI
jgi:diguanylate cyclase (GGDEF)-like protein